MKTQHIPATDGYLLAAQVYAAKKEAGKGKVLIVNSATAVNKILYHHYANYMSDNGYHVITYDYRGIAGSRPKKLRGFEASFTHWGEKDFSGIIDYAITQFPNHKLVVFGHSIGGTIVGMNNRVDKISGVINIGAQTAYYKDWASSEKTKLYLLWHVLLPFVSAIVGYFPGRAFKMTEDVPLGVIKQWHSRRLTKNMFDQFIENGHKLHYNQYKGKLLTLHMEDDPIGTLKAVQRIHDLFTVAHKELETIKPIDVPTNEIGHFGFFSRKFKPTLWPKTLKWFDEV